MENRIYIFMGVSGCGKTTIGKLFAETLGAKFYDGDTFHPESNIEKMAAGIPLTDDDRYNWLVDINKQARELFSSGQSAVFACSALKEAYRVLVAQQIGDAVVWIYLKGDVDTIHLRLKNRKGHFMSPELLQSQFDILEEPDSAIYIDTALDTNTIIQTIVKKLTKSEFGLVGLGVMGKSLARNFAGKGISLSLYNRFIKGSEEQIAEKSISEYPELHSAVGFEDLKSFAESLERPRKIFLMIKAGEETDTFIDELVPYLNNGDVIIDGGNSYYGDTQRRILFLKLKGIHFIGTGVSGGEQGALTGPSIMPSGPAEAYKLVERYLTLIAAKDKSGDPCCTYIGIDGSGHFVKMIHNGIEYAEMQLIAEVYVYLRYAVKMQPPQIAAVFTEWDKSELNSYLLGITAALLVKKEGDAWLIDLILDKAGNKGTGNWATIAASELGQPATLITSALLARYVSTIKENIRVNGEQATEHNLETISLPEIRDAYRLARIVNHQQGFMLIDEASKKYSWDLNLAEIARIWTNGCIIRSAFMEELVLVLKKDSNIFENATVLKQLKIAKSGLKMFAVSALQYDLSIPSHLAALDYLNVLMGNYATANIIQAQRDYFGAHTYQKIGDSTGKYYHTEW
ncbi:NADP-dependent phosphogluconate dehydrogenase [Cytophaga aurantiaca]|uniref:NADP-dependent phosphogluconate dehydrogenase n=1 Tax=Cytophaga aurantiaca TaxID=29530 RepID=UPI0003A2042C|nr:NADP-dependent phosphogluconate dehydrogenase [Cytophaga aurantiaca]